MMVKLMTHRTSVWLHERVGLSALCQRPDKNPELGASESRTLSQQTVVGGGERDHVRPGDAHPKSTNGLVSSSPSVDNADRQDLKQNISLSPE